MSNHTNDFHRIQLVIFLITFKQIINYSQIKCHLKLFINNLNFTKKKGWIIVIGNVYLFRVQLRQNIINILKYQISIG